MILVPVLIQKTFQTKHIICKEARISTNFTDKKIIDSSLGVDFELYS